LVVESRAYPLFRYNPDLGVTPEDCFDLEGNPAMEDDWPIYQLAYTENGRKKSMELPFTFADFAATEIRFRKHFRVAPPETWNDKMVLVDAYLQMSDEERQEYVPYVWSVNRQQQLMRLLVAPPIIHSCEDRRDFWKMLKSIARVGDSVPDRSQIEADVRKEMTGRIANGIMQLITGNASESAYNDATVIAAASSQTTAPGGQAAATSGNGAIATGAESMAPWIDTPQCTSCDECIKLNPAIFQYDGHKKATIKNPQGGPYKDLVKAAERCTAQIIHPGLPKDRSEKDIDKWIARAEKYNR
jgi:pyruvate-ferredoxin/flavodoxin oxidoreductase